MTKEFCCENMKNGWLSSCMLEIDEDDIKNPSNHQNTTYHMDDNPEYRKVNVGELYLYNDEMSQIEGEPFRFCPWCGFDLERETY